MVTYDASSAIEIVNRGDITANSGIIADGIRAQTDGTTAQSASSTAASPRPEIPIVPTAFTHSQTPMAASSRSSESAEADRRLEAAAKGKFA